MNKLLKYAVTIALGGYCIITQAKVTVPTIEQLPTFTPNERHEDECPRIFNYFTKSHYKIVDVNEAFARKVIDRLMSFLDYGHTLYTQVEVDNIYMHNLSIIDAMDKCYLDYPFKLYTENVKKRFQKYKFFVDTIKSPLNLDENDSIEIDRSKAPYAANDVELHKLWLRELKNEYETQRLNGKTDKQAVERIVRRYEAAMSRLPQITSEDAFSVFENAFATAIDPHTNYFGPVESENFNDDMNLSLEGIGAVLSQDDEYTKIQSIMPGSPAEKSKKLKAKDKIVGVKQADGKYFDVIGWRINDVVKKIKGPKGTEVTLEIERDEGASTKTFNVTLVREKIRLQDREAKSKVYTGYNNKNIGVITISSFYTNLHLDVKREIEKLKEANVDGIIVDLRNNGGGLLPEAVDTTGLFIKDGPVVLVKDVAANQEIHDDDDSDSSYDGPLVVLVNRLSASSSEIMAAALQDYGRAIVIGDTTFGKGTVQQSRPLTRLYDLASSEHGSIHYTMAKFYRINGGSTQLKGVTPEIAIPTSSEYLEVGEDKEPNALKWDQIIPAEYDRYFDTNYFVPSLISRSQKRIEKDPVFKVIAEENKILDNAKKDKTITLNFKEREKRFKEDEKRYLKNTNIRLKAMGKPEVKNVKDIPEDFEFDDPILNEAVNITSDYVSMVDSDGPQEAAKTPVLLKYSVKND